MWQVCATGLCQVSEGVDGLLLQQLATITEHKDPQCVSFFRQGAPFLGQLPCSGNGTPLVIKQPGICGSVAGAVRCEQCSIGAVAARGCACAKVAHAYADDAKLGRMSEPQLFVESKLEGVRLAPRFPVVKQKEDGSTCVRPVDNFSWSALK